LGAQIEDMEGKIDLLGSLAQDKAKAEINELKSQESKLEATIERIEHAAEEEWDEIREAINESSKDFKAGFKKLFGG
jgi:cytochrome c556